MARAALVTGGSRGIGAAAAACLARAGFSVAIGYGRSKARAEALAASLRAENRNAMAVEIDVCDRASVRAALEQGKIEPTRYDSYRRLYELAKDIKPWELKERGN